MKKITKKQMMIDESLKISKEYPDIKLTLRQIYYRLVSKMLIQNKNNDYKYLSKALVHARKNGLVPFDIIEDRTRVVDNKSNQMYYTPEKLVDYLLNQLLTRKFHLSHNLYQQDLVIIALEKQALESVFQQVLKDNSNAILIVGKGYNSLTQMKDLFDIVKNDPRKIHCKFFSDYDPTGLDIQRNFLKQRADLGIDIESFERIGLNAEQIAKYSLPSSPPKKKDSRAKNWKGGGVVELDALDPPILQKLITDSLQKHWNQDLEQEVKHLERVLQEKFEKKISVVRERLEGLI